MIRCADKDREAPDGMARILVIDDEPQIRLLLRMILEEDGHAVVEAANGLAAMQRWQEAPASLVITDILMPDKDGLEVIAELRRRSPQTPIIAISGGSLAMPVRMLDIAGRLGAAYTVDKPFAVETMRQLVSSALAAPCSPPPSSVA